MSIYTKYTIVTNKCFKSNDNINQYYYFSKLIKNTSGYIYVYDYESLYDIKKNISNLTGLPIETIYEIGDLGGGNGEYFKYNNITSLYALLKEYCSFIQNCGIYFLVDLYLSPSFQKINEAQLENDRKTKTLEQNLQNLQWENQNNKNQINNLLNQNNNLRKQQEKERKDLENNVKTLRSQYDNLKWEYQNNKDEINNLRSQNNNLRKQQEKEKKDLENNVKTLRSQCENLKWENQTNKNQINNLIDQNKDLKRKQEEEKNEFEKNVRSVKNENQILKTQCENLKLESQTNKNQINNLITQNNNLQKKQEEEENKKNIKKKNFENFRNAFEKDKQTIENKNLEESKIKITDFIVNDYVTPFFSENNENIPHVKTLSNSMTKFTEEFIDTYCPTFNQSFKSHSKKIVENYNVKGNKFSIEHINFIVIGKAGTGKSTFINSCLLLPKDKRAKEGDGVSVTDKSTLYCSDKLKMIRMWDTQGIDYEISIDYILTEVERIVNKGLEKGPDNYINIILYCTTGNRFQKKDGELIQKIMKLYPMDNLPVIITQLQVYFKIDQLNMEKTIREILKKYLEYQIVEKIPVKTVISRDKVAEGKTYKAKGIPELLKCSFDMTGRAITSATFKKFSDDIKNLCKEFVDSKISFIEKKCQYEMEILDVAEKMYINNAEKIFDKVEKQTINLSKENIYNNIKEKNFFPNNFIKILTSKYIDIFNNLNNKNINENDKDECVLMFFQNRLLRMQEILNKVSEKIFKTKYNELFQGYLTDLNLKQSSRNTEFNTKKNIINSSEIDKRFKEELYKFLQNEVFKYFMCIILRLFMNNLKRILTNKYQKELNENEEMKKIINSKAETSLKSIIERLKEKLLLELDKYFPKQEEEKKVEENNARVDFEFPED